MTMERRTSKNTLYRRPSSNVVTPKIPVKNQRQSRPTALPVAVAKIGIRRSSSACNVLARPNTAGRARASSIGRASVAHSIGRPSNPLGWKSQVLAKDPRPISDKQYQCIMVKGLVEFLADQEYRGDIPLTEKKLRQAPTAKEFMALVEFLYRYIDENYKYKNQQVEIELPALLKPLGYPFLPNASLLKSFNAPQYWPSVLASASWLKELVMFGLNFDFEKAMFPSADGDYEGNAGNSLAHTIYMYYCQCFVSHQSGNDDFADFDQMLGDQLDAEGVSTRIENLSTENERLKAELQMLEARLLEPKSSEESIKSMKLDVENLDGFFTQMDDYIRVKQRALVELQEQKETNDHEIEKIKDEISKKKEFISKQGMKPADVQRMGSERNELLKWISSHQAEKQELEMSLWDMEKQVAKMKQPLEQKAAEFSKKAKALVRDMPALREVKGELEIAPFAPDFLCCVKDYIWPWINEIKKIVLEEVDLVSSKNIDTQNQIAQLKIQLRDLECDANQLDKKIQQREIDIISLPEQKDQENQRLREQRDALEAEYENVKRQKQQTLTAKKEALLKLNQECEEKKQEVALKINESEEVLELAMAIAEKNLRKAGGITDQVQERIDILKNEIMKRSE